MDPNTPTLMFPPDFWQKAITDGTAQAATILRPIFTQAALAIWHHAPAIIAVVSLLLVIALFKAAFGYWGMLGSLLYHIFYFSIFGVILWVRGPELLFSDYYELIGLILNPICYWLTGLILQRFRLRRTHAFI
ncbi:MAG: hypothetical protein QY323_01820 [Patescibacteria group bacterium]|nr:MAG: hypothetical protein QY323_01820 [Patescibacteria group bacterium]